MTTINEIKMNTYVSIRNLSFALFLFLVMPSCSEAPEVVTPMTVITDSLLPDNVIADIDGNQYHIVQIGEQWWMAENLRTTKYNDGENIPYGWPLDPDNDYWDLPTTPGYCWYNNDVSNKIPHGALYNWLTVNTGKLCPVGWHVPTSSEWNILRDYLTANQIIFEDGSTDVAKSIASTSGWEIPQPMEYHGVLIPVPEGYVGRDQTSNNRYEFNAFPSGIRAFQDRFMTMGKQAAWWSATGPANPWDFSMNYSGTDLSQGSDYKRNGFSVRCVKNL